MIARKPTISPDKLAALKARVSMPSLVAKDIPVRRAGRDEFIGLCPFHAERSPSFRVYRDHAFCFGCGWYGDQIGWLMGFARLGFIGAVQVLCAWTGADDPVDTDLDIEPRQAESEWRPIHPVPLDAPPLIAGSGRTVRVYNPKRSGERWEWSSWHPAAAYPYRSGAGELLGFVLRVVPKRGRKFTPTVTYCQSREGERRWCIIPFGRPAPLYGLDRIAARSGATVVLVEGEKTADAARRLLPSMVATTWPGGSNAYRHVDFAPLRGRKVVCVADADESGRNAFHGRRDRRGKRIPGVLELLSEAGALTRVVDPEPERVEGWDLADAEAEGWGTAGVMVWLKGRLTEVRDAA
jgi:hypothetical protein